MRFSSLGSGSRGNAAMVEHADTCILVDCGFSAREAERRMERLGKHPSGLHAILVTHEHSDHISGVGRLARKYGLAVWMTPGTAAAAKDVDAELVQLISGYEEFTIGDLTVKPFPVPHDAREPSQFVFEGGGDRLGFLTDTGSITEHIVKMLRDCSAIFLECNHDSGMLAGGAYPDVLKQRVGGQYGHLNNEQAAALLQRMDLDRLQLVVAAHLSEKNNTPEQAHAALARVLGDEQQIIVIAGQTEGLDWHQSGPH